jgi:hypothetical protein
MRGGQGQRGLRQPLAEHPLAPGDVDRRGVGGQLQQGGLDQAQVEDLDGDDHPEREPRPPLERAGGLGRVQVGGGHRGVPSGRAQPQESPIGVAWFRSICPATASARAPTPRTRAIPSLSPWWKEPIASIEAFSSE